MQTSEHEQQTKLFGASPAVVATITSDCDRDLNKVHGTNIYLNTTTHNNNSHVDSNVEIPIQLTNLNSQANGNSNNNNAWMLPPLLVASAHSSKMNSSVNKKNNSISDSSTADSDSGYMDDTRYESENEFFPVDLELSNCASAGSNKRILSGFAGRAKNSEQAPSICADNTRSMTFNYGDDVGFICSKNLNEAEFLPHELSAESELSLGCSDPAKLVNKYYFGLADGVSANRQRGYDAKLFPNALIGACAELSDQSAEYLTNYAINHRSSVMDEKLKSEECKAQNGKLYSFFYHRADKGYESFLNECHAMGS